MFCIAADKLGVPRPCCIQNDMSLNERSFEGDVAEACHYLCRNQPYGAFDRLHHVLVDSAQVITLGWSACPTAYSRAEH